MHRVQVPARSRHEPADRGRLAGRQGRHADAPRDDGAGAARRHDRASRDAPQHRGDPPQGHPPWRHRRGREGRRDHPAGGRAGREGSHRRGTTDRAAEPLPRVQGPGRAGGPEALLREPRVPGTVPREGEVVCGTRADGPRRLRREARRSARRCEAGRALRRLVRTLEGRPSRSRAGRRDFGAEPARCGRGRQVARPLEGAFGSGHSPCRRRDREDPRAALSRRRRASEGDCGGTRGAARLRPHHRGGGGGVPALEGGGGDLRASRQGGRRSREPRVPRFGW